MEPDPRKEAVVVYAVVICIAVLLPIGAVLAGHWVFHVSLPTLMFISFLLLLVGSIVCWPAVDREAVSSEAVVVLLLGQASAVGVLILYFIRLYRQGILFAWM